MERGRGQVDRQHPQRLRVERPDRHHPRMSYAASSPNGIGWKVHHRSEGNRQVPRSG